MPGTALPDRTVVRITGPDAEKLLQDVLTPDLGKLDGGNALPGALLTPQGKIMFDFVIGRDGADGFLIDIDREHAEAFAKRMALYKLRAKAEIGIDEALTVGACWREKPPEGALRDLRFRENEPVYRLYGNDIQGNDRDGYTRLRLAHGVAESGADFALSDVFPHDVLMDLNGGVSFRKGCFVGQEVVSRMQHRGTARRRLALVTADEALPASGTEITAGGKTIGTLGTVLGSDGLAIVRTDRAGSAVDAGTPVTAGDVTVRLSLPEWTGLQMTAGEDA